jgi:hypothetical protein
MRAKLTLCVFILIIGGFFLLNRVIAPPEISESERRPLEKMPTLSLDAIRSAKSLAEAFDAYDETFGTFSDRFETFAADSFFLRDGFRAIRAASVYYVFWHTDKDGLYFGASGAGKFEPIDERVWRQAAAKIRVVGDALTEAGVNVYYSFIPDKSIYAGVALPGFDADEARAILGEELSYTFIDITGALSGADFYKTDLHWNQPSLANVVSALGNAMGFSVDFGHFTQMTAGEFAGVYAGQVALPLKPDVMAYMQNPAISARYMNDRMEWYAGDVYDLEAFEGRDPYNIFLKGAQPLIILENPNASADRELYLFRDSFGSSLAPLLSDAYARVTVIDLRYADWRALRMEELPMFVEFKEGADALVIYSSRIYNNASILLVTP